MTYECMYVKERLEYVRAHLVCTPHGAGKEIHSKMLVKMSLTFLDWRVLPSHSFRISQDGETQANPSHLSSSLPFKVYVTFDLTL